MPKHLLNPKLPDEASELFKSSMSEEQLKLEEAGYSESIQLKQCHHNRFLD